MQEFVKSLDQQAEEQGECCMKVFGAVAMGLQSGQFSLSGAAGHRPAVMTENKKMTLLLGMINGARVVFAIKTTSYHFRQKSPTVNWKLFQMNFLSELVQQSC